MHPALSKSTLATLSIACRVCILTSFVLAYRNAIRNLNPALTSLLTSMSPLATLCDLPIRTGFDGHAATSCVSLDWVIKSGLRAPTSPLSGLLTLPCDIGVISMVLKDLLVTDSPSCDLLLGLDWFNFVRSSEPELVVHLDSGSLDLRHSSHLIVDAAEAGSSSTAITPVTGVDDPSLPSSVSLGNPDAVTAPSSIPRTRGIDVVAASMHASRMPRSRGIPPSPRSVTNFEEDGASSSPNIRQRVG
ncbi:hypothetical protein C8R47DRAFT_1190487 [Mycena vitilis]|nr:hypothetical protein C8R47DRAFT_1190487 [Mycena vitilis]